MALEYANGDIALHRSPNEVDIQSGPESALFEDEDSIHPSVPELGM
jgi:hypothetical protein